MKIPSISSIKLEGLGEVSLTSGALVFVVGPNDGGKSTFLRDIVETTKQGRAPIWGLTLSWDLGSAEEYSEYVAAEFDADEDSRFRRLRTSGARLMIHNIDQFFSTHKISNSVFLIRLLDASTRIGLADPVESPDVMTGDTNHPFHRFFYDSALENEFSEKLASAFGTSLRVNRTGKQTGAYLGDAPTGERLSSEYEIEVITKMTSITDTGDGIRSYTGILLNASADSRPITLIDEPEAFLHPPQARRLGRELADEAKRTKRQTFIATHSSEIIQGALSSTNKDVHLIYLNRKADKTAHYVPREVVNSFSDSPFLAQTNSLDALFYDRAFICEAPADIMFFRWIIGSSKHSKFATEAFWLASYGKSAIPGMVEEIKRLGVSAISIFDIDVLLSADTMESLCRAYDLDFEPVKKIIGELEKSVRVPPVAETLQKIEETIAGVAEDDDDSSRASTVRTVKRITNSLGKSWYLKSVGVAAVPKGELRKKVEDLLRLFRQRGIIILREGEIENYGPEISGHGPAWVRQVIEEGKITAEDRQKVVAHFDDV